MPASDTTANSGGGHRFSPLELGLLVLGAGVVIWLVISKFAPDSGSDAERKALAASLLESDPRARISHRGTKPMKHYRGEEDAVEALPGVTPPQASSRPGTLTGEAGIEAARENFPENESLDSTTAPLLDATLLEPPDHEAARALSAKEQKRALKKGKLEPVEIIEENPYQWSDYVKDLMDQDQISDSALRKATSRLNLNEVTDALNTLQSKEWGRNSELVLRGLMSRMGQLNPQQAIDYAQQFDSRRMKSQAMNSILGAWFKQDPEAGYQWAMDNFNNKELGVQSSDVGRLFGYMAKENKELALQRMMALPDSTLRKYAFGSIVETIPSEQREGELLALYNTMGSSEDKAMVADKIVYGMARYNPDQAAAFVDSLQDPVAYKKAAGQLVYNWSYDRPDQAADWVLKMQDPTQRDTHLYKVVSSWARDNPTGATEWVGNRPPSPEMDPAAKAMARTFGKENPGEAILWAESISNTKDRSATVYTVAREWLKQDPEPARSYIQNSPDISEKYKARMLGIEPAKKK